MTAQKSVIPMNEHGRAITQEDIKPTVLPDAYLRFAGGVARFSGKTMVRAYRAGINSAILGDMLTTAGEDIATNIKRIEEAGYEF